MFILLPFFILDTVALLYVGDVFESIPSLRRSSKCVIIMELSLCDALDSIQGNIVDFMANRVIIVLTKKLRSMAPRRSQ